MNFGKTSLQKKREILNYTGRSVYSRIPSAALFLIFLGIAAAAVIFVLWGSYRIRTVLRDTPPVSAVLEPSYEASDVLDAGGTTIAEFHYEDLYRQDLKSEDLPEQIGRVFVTGVDEEFYEHHGVRLQSLLSAWLKSFFRGKHYLAEPGTITERLVENSVYLGVSGKGQFGNGDLLIQRQHLAAALEEEKSKEWILTAWLNTVDLGENIRGIRAGADRYFGKDVKELTISEAAVLAAMIDEPDERSPVLHPKKNDVVRRKILEKMKDSGLLEEAEYLEAVRDQVYGRIPTVREGFRETLTGGFADSLKKNLINELKAGWHCTQEQADNMLYLGGLTISSTCDSGISRIAEQRTKEAWTQEEARMISLQYRLSVRRPDQKIENYTGQDFLAWLKQQNLSSKLLFSSRDEAEKRIGEYRSSLLSEDGTVLGEQIDYIAQPQAAVVVMNQSSGEVLAMLGDRMEEKTASQNRADGANYDAGGAAWAPGVYAAVLDNGYYTLSDEPDAGQTESAEKSSEKGLTLREIIAGQEPEQSKSIETLLSGELCQQTLEKFGMEHKGSETRATVLETAAAYAAIANSGIWKQPVFYTKVTDRYSTNMLQSRVQDHPVIKNTTAWLLTQSMKDSVDYGKCSLAKLGRMPAAAQEGEPAADGSVWFSGFTPYYTCTVWSGYDTGDSEADVRTALKIWYDIMGEIHEDLVAKAFEKPEGILSETICSLSGQQAVEGVCPDVRTEFYAYGTQPEGYCGEHETALICKASGLLATENCPESEVEQRAYRKAETDPEKQMPKRKCTLHKG